MERVQNIPKELISSTFMLDYKTPMSKAGPYLKKYPALIINKNREYYGVMDSRTIYRVMHGLRSSPDEKVERFSIKAPRITDSTSIYDLVSYFYKSGVKALPYTSGSKIVGVLERKTLLKVLLSLNILSDTKVNQAMTTPVLSIDSKASIAQAKSVMRERKVNRLVVMQNSKFTGIITNHDIVDHYTKNAERFPKMKTESYTPANIPISSVMETNTVQIEHNRNVSEAVREMIENKVSSLVVMKSRNPVGIITVTDVFESVLARQRAEPGKIFMSGFDTSTFQYEDDAREALMSLVAQIERLSGMEADYLTFKVKHHGKLYEMQARLSLGRHGIISMHTTRYLFEDALAELIKKLKNRVIKEKESILTHKKVNTLRDAI